MPSLISTSAGNIKGLREVNAAFRRIERQVQRELEDEMFRRAGPVAATARSKISRYQGAKISTIKPGRSRRGAVVRQGARSRRLRPDFGSLQMRRMFEAVSENEAEIYRGVESLIESEIRRAGF
jgi:hypothetical protein